MKDMELVYAIYRYGSFSRAAEELYISQSSLSMAIQRIEAEVGTALIDRRQHPAKLTQAGEEFIHFYQKVKPLHMDMLKRIEDISEMRSGSFSLGGTHYLLSYILPETIVGFAERYPDVKLRITEAQSGRFRDLLLRCEIDLCLMCDMHDPKLQALGHAFFDTLYLAVPREQVERLSLSPNALTGDQICEGAEPIYNHYFRTEDIEKITFLQLTQGNNLFNRSEQIFSQLGVRPRRMIHFHQFVTAYNLAGCGLGCTLVSSRLIMKHKQPNLVYYSLPTPFMIRDFHFTTRKDAYVSKSVRAFCELFAQLEEEKQNDRPMK